MNYEQMSNNKLQLTGKIAKKPEFTHEVMGENFYDSVLSVSRLSGQSDNIPITVSDRFLTQYDFEVGSTISIIGQFRSYNKVENGKSRLLLTAFVRDVVDETELENPNMIEL
ncbi:MAG: single-stranded DNA-binding protein, partial [Clostridia bacterium]